VAQLHELVTFLEEKTGRPFDLARFQERIELSRRAAQAWSDTLQLCRSVPSPLNMFEAFVAMGPIVAVRGTAETAQFYEDVRAEVADRVANGVAAVPGERFRIYWDNIPLWYRIRETAEQLAAHGACVVAATYPDSWSFQYLDAERPFETLAEALNLVTVNWGVKQRSAKMKQSIQRYGCDGLIMHSARTCKAYFIGQYDIREAMERECGVPGIVIDADHTDPRAFSEAQVAARIDAFMEGLAARKPA
jgi:benzoyl-CoA reductase/2-hydroxyglutaryl-CoA dehydratase subunit BcrC/BadD/HgdB